MVNVALYVPAGFTGHLAFRRSGKMWVAVAAPVLICTAFSASIEMTQLFVPTRDCSALDLLTNILGSVVGVFAAIVVEEFFPRGRVRVSSRKPPDRAALSLLACWLGWLVFPFFPVMGRTALAHKFAMLVHSPMLDAAPLIATAIAWIAAGSLFQAAAFRFPRWIAPTSTLLIPAQVFILDRQPAAAEFTGAIAGAACFALLRPVRKAHRTVYRKSLAWAFLAAIVLRGLAPFQFRSEAGPFSWIPFSGFLAMNWQPGAQVMAEKFFWYGTAIWLMQLSGMRLRAATGVVAATLLVIEIVQTHTPGRTAEITDPLLGIFAGLALAVVGNAARAGVTAIPSPLDAHRRTPASGR